MKQLEHILKAWIGGSMNERSQLKRRKNMETLCSVERRSADWIKIVVRDGSWKYHIMVTVSLHNYTKQAVCLKL